MPHTTHVQRTTTSSGDDLGSTDEVKVFKDEGDRDDEKNSAENLLEEKSSLIDLTESEEKSSKILSRSGNSPVFNKIETHPSAFNMGYLVSPYQYTNGSGGLPVTMANKIGLPCFFGHTSDHLTTPPPAHCGIPPYQLDPKSIGLPRPAIYPFPSAQYPYSMINPDMSQVATWHTPSVYSPASGFRNPYPTSLPINTNLPGEFSFRFSPNILPTVHASQHHMLNVHSEVSSTVKVECNKDVTACHRYGRSLDNKNLTNVQTHEMKDNIIDKKKSHIKKPLNAFMLYMKEMRAKVVAECTLKESAAINQILGRRWHELSREEQSKYYEKARQERQLHMELYPGWSARDNYGYVSKKKKRKKDRSPADSNGNNMKKCRARFGLDQQNQWCKPCKRKKKCIRYMESLGANRLKEEGFNDTDDGQRSDDEDIERETGGSCDSGDENTKNYEDDNESLSQSLSSPCGFSSFQSPSARLASPVIPQEQSMHHQQHTAIQPQNINQQTANQISSHFSQVIPISSSCSTSSSYYDTEPINSITSSSNVISNILSSLTTSPSPISSSGTLPGFITSSCPTSSSASLSASLSDRMMRSLLSSSPAVLLGNRLSHIAMGLAMNNSNNTIVSNSQFNNGINNENTNNSSSSLLAAGKAEMCKTITPTTTTVTTISSHQHSIASTYSRAVGADKAVVSSVNEIPSTISRLISSPLSAISDLCKNNVNSIQRSPIGANPRDINNPLSIDQLTKRTNEDCSGASFAEVNNCVLSTKLTKFTSQDGRHLIPGNLAFNQANSSHPTSQATLMLPQHTQSAIFENPFPQHFHHLNQNIAGSAAPSTSSTEISPAFSQTMIKNNSIKSGSNSVNRRSSSETTNESCAINVT